MPGDHVELITSRQNLKVKQIVDLCADAGYRSESGLCVAHGIKLCAETERFGLAIRSLWLTNEADAKYGAELERIKNTAQKIYYMTQDVCDKISPMRTPQGIAAVVELPKAAEMNELAQQSRVIVLDSVQNPGNVGAVIRIAAALGYDGVIIGGNAADPFSPKALRASMGAAFGQSIAQSTDLMHDIEKLKEAGHKVYAAAIAKDAEEITGIKVTEKITLVIGSEGNGLEKEIIDICDCAVIIPMTDRVESLNASTAAAITMWELRP